MKRYSVRCSENGDIIVSSDSLDVAYCMMVRYVLDDLDELDIDTSDFYEIYDNEKECVLDCWKTVDGNITFVEL